MTARIMWILFWMLNESVWFQNSVTHAQSTCASALEPRLSLGGYARIVQISDVIQYVGSPYASDEINGLNIAAIPFPLDPTRDMFVSEGPVCHTGRFMWRVRVLETADNLDNDRWIFESLDSDYLLIPSSTPRQSIVAAYTPQTVNLSTITPETAIDPFGQLAALGGAGGGTGIPPYNSYVYPGSLTDKIWTIFPTAIVVSTTIFQPDGTKYSAQSLNAFDSVYGDGYVEVELPTQLGLSEGIWFVELATRTETRRIAYDYRTPRPSLWVNCTETGNAIYMSGFEPLERFRLIQLEDYTEIDHWLLEADAHGSLVVEDFTGVFKIGARGSYGTAFAVDTAVQPWQQNVENARPTSELRLLTPEIYASCYVNAPTSIEQALEQPLTYGGEFDFELVTTEAYHAITADPGVIDISVETPADLTVTLMDADGVELATGNLISDLPISQGTYLLVVGGIAGSQYAIRMGKISTPPEPDSSYVHYCQQIVGMEAFDEINGGDVFNLVDPLYRGELPLGYGRYSWARSIVEEPLLMYEAVSTQSPVVDSINPTAEFFVNGYRICADGHLWLPVVYGSSEGWIIAWDDGYTAERIVIQD